MSMKDWPLSKRFWWSVLLLFGLSSIIGSIFIHMGFGCLVIFQVACIPGLLVSDVEDPLWYIALFPPMIIPIWLYKAIPKFNTWLDSHDTETEFKSGPAPEK